MPIPQDPPHTITFRKLRGLEYEHAQAEHARAVRDGHAPRVWAVTLRRMLETGSATDPQVQAAIADPMLGFDRYSIIKSALVGWTYNGGAPTPEQIDDLDEDAVELIARAILRHSKPSLFETPAERQDAKKND